MTKAMTDKVLTDLVNRIMAPVYSHMMALEILYPVTFVQKTGFGFNMVFPDTQHVSFNAATVDWNQLYRTADVWSRKLRNETKTEVYE